MAFSDVPNIGAGAGKAAGLERRRGERRAAGRRRGEKSGEGGRSCGEATEGRRRGACRW